MRQLPAHRSLGLTAVAALSLLALGACGSSSSTAATTAAPAATAAAAGTTAAAATTAAAGTTAAGSTAAAATTAASGGDAALTIKGFAFSKLSTTAGTQITITNSDSFAHTVTAKDGSFDVKVGGGSTATLTIPKAGTYDIVCKIHPSMKGTITVG
jgi:plastocyanin